MSSREMPVSRKEEALWLLEKFTPGTGVNNLSITVEVDGHLQPDLVAAALEHVVCKYENLSTVFAVSTSGPDGPGGALTKRILEPDELSIVVAEDDLPADADADSDLAQVLGSWVGEPFAVNGELLVRARILHGAGRDILCIAIHHLVFDTVSQGILLAEFTAAYDAMLDGTADALSPVRLPAAVESEPSERSRRFWSRQLADFGAVNPELAIGADAGSSTDLDGAVVTRWLSPEAVEIVQALQGQLRASEAVVLLAAYYALLARHGAGPDLVVGTPVNSRPREAPDAIGYHINVVPLRTTVDLDAGFDALIKKTRSVFLNSISHADVPVDTLLGEVDRAGSSWRNTLFRHVFNYVPDNGDGTLQIGGLDATLMGIENGSSKFDLELFVLPTDEGTLLRTAYHRDAFTRIEVEALVERYDALIVAAGQQLSAPVAELSLLGATDRAVIESANGTGAPAAPSVLREIFDRARETPDAIAVVDGASTRTYAQLVGAAVRNAAALDAAGVRPGDVVAVAAPRGAELAAAAVSVWLAGGRYLPIDPSHPQERIAYQFEDSGTTVALRAPGLALPVDDTVQLLDCSSVDGPPATAEDLDAARTPEAGERAYQMYTSGSTGKPKGTLLTHVNLDNLIAAFRADLDVGPGTGVLWSTTFTFDISTLELFLPLVAGGRLVIAADADRHDGERLAALIGAHDVAIVQATPTAWRIVIDKAAPALDGRIVLCGGEPMPPVLAERLVASGADVRNVYGPTETCIWSTAGPITADDPAGVTVGRPLRNTTVFVADGRGNDLPLFVPGELCIAGDGVCDGYHERPELTGTRFGERPDLGRFYRTGDRARWLADGRLQVLGRADRQIKLRGVRIELGEIEAVLTTHASLRNSAVVVIGDPSSDGELVAFVEPQPEASADPDELWRHTKAKLPLAMTPSAFHVVESLPTNAANKVDYPTLTAQAQRRRTELAAQRVVSGASPADAGQPDDPLLSILVPIFGQVLGRADVAADTNFFAYGGHSLLAVMLVQTIADKMGTELALTDVFAAPTPEGVAGLLSRAAT